MAKEEAMISPHTMPGTKVVCSIKGGLLNPALSGTESPLEVGRKYEVSAIHCKSDGTWSGHMQHCEFYAILEGFPGYGFCLSLLDYPALPESLTSLLNTKPVDDPYIDAIEKLRADQN